jgi:ribosome-associated heat shock protein Hsp15
VNCRFDIFLWSVRLAKTRSKSTELIKNNKALLNGKSVKPSKEIKVGDIVSMKKHNATLSFKVHAILNKRVGAKLVHEYLTDTTNENELNKLREYRDAQSIYRVKNEGKPSKKDRRDLDDFMKNWD